MSLIDLSFGQSGSMVCSRHLDNSLSTLVPSLLNAVSDQSVCPPLFIEGSESGQGMQVRGFYLHDLTRSTHGKYVELGKSQKKVPVAVQKLLERIPQGEEANVR